MTDISLFDDQNIIARTAYGENRGGGISGMQSVINVIMNRSKHPAWWGKTPREICLHPEQFDCWLPNDPNYRIITTANESMPMFANAMMLAGEALAGTLNDITNGSLYYFAEYMKPWPHWAQGHNPAAYIAGQLFFNDIAI